MEFRGDNVSIIELLPFEVVEIISYFLTGQDLGACCATSHKWRELFNINRIWKNRCDACLALYLKDSPCKVEPSFVNPEIGNEMEPICEWRLAYMRENHLRNNWILGRCKKEITIQPSSIPGLLIHSFYDNDYVVAIYKERIELLDVRKSTLESVIEPISFPDNVGYFLKVLPVKGMLITIFKSLIAVFYLNLDTKQYSLKCMFFLKSPDKLSINNSQGLLSWQTQLLLVQRLCSTKIVFLALNNIFVGSSYQESTLHFWDVTSGHKLKEEVCPLNDRCIIMALKICEPNLMLVVFKHFGEYSHSFLVYDLEQLVFLPFRQKIQGFANYEAIAKYLILGNINVLRLYNYRTSELFFEILDCRCPQIIGNDILFLEGNELKIFISTIEEFKSLYEVNASSFRVISTNFIELKNEIWLIKGKANKQIKKTALDSCLMGTEVFCESNTRCIQEPIAHVIGSVRKILHFW